MSIVKRYNEVDIYRGLTQKAIKFLNDNCVTLTDTVIEDKFSKVVLELGILLNEKEKSIFKIGFMSCLNELGIGNLLYFREYKIVSLKDTTLHLLQFKLRDGSFIETFIQDIVDLKIALRMTDTKELIKESSW